MMYILLFHLVVVIEICDCYYNEVYLNCSNSALNDFTMSINEEKVLLKQWDDYYVSFKPISFAHNDSIKMKTCNPAISDSFKFYQAAQYANSFNTLNRGNQFLENWGGNFRNTILENHISIDLASKLLKPTIEILQPSRVQKILHVATKLYISGGHSRVIMSFFQFLKNKTQILYLTEPGRNFGIKSIACSSTQPLDCAVELRLLSLSFDLIILHVHGRELPSTLAFGRGYHGPPVAFFDHADHENWLGNSVIDARLIFRSASARLALQRGLDPNRDIRMPLPASFTTHTQKNPSKQQVKKFLKIPPQSVVLAAMASTHKFGKTLEYANMIISVLKNNPNAYFLGVGVHDIWSKIFADEHVNPSQYRLGNAVSAVEAVKYHIAADIHIDSFPHTGATSILESMIGGSICIGYSPWTDTLKYIACLEPIDYGYQYEQDIATIPIYKQLNTNNYNNNSYNSTNNDNKSNNDNDNDSTNNNKKTVKIGPLLTCRTANAFQTVLNHLLTNSSALQAYQEFTKQSTCLHTGNDWAYAMENVFNEVLQLPRRDRNIPLV